jgi:tetratricopeptide (TPR) repeat protein
MAEALSLFEQSLERAAAIKFLPCNSLWIGWWGEASLLAGHVEDARQHGQRALDISRAQKERGYEAYALRLLGDIAAQRQPPDVEPAKTPYLQSLALATTLGMRPLQAHCHRGLGMLYRQVGRTEQARAELSTAIDLYRAMDMTFWLPPAEATLAEMS